MNDNDSDDVLDNDLDIMQSHRWNTTWTGNFKFSGTEEAERTHNLNLQTLLRLKSLLPSNADPLHRHNTVSHLSVCAASSTESSNGAHVMGYQGPQQFLLDRSVETWIAPDWACICTYSALVAAIIPNPHCWVGILGQNTSLETGEYLWLPSITESCKPILKARTWQRGDMWAIHRSSASTWQPLCLSPITIFMPMRWSFLLSPFVSLVERLVKLCLFSCAIIYPFHSSGSWPCGWHNLQRCKTKEAVGGGQNNDIRAFRVVRSENHSIQQHCFT